MQDIYIATRGGISQTEQTHVAFLFNSPYTERPLFFLLFQDIHLTKVCLGPIRNQHSNVLQRY